MTSSCSRTAAGPGWAKMVRMVAATISAEPFGTWASTLRRKCTRHRCQAAPRSTEPIAVFSPACASEMISCTPPRPRAFSDRRNAVQNAPSSLSATSNPRTSRCPSAATPVATTTACDTTRWFTRALQ
jgi:hypothetical protein